MGTAIGEAVLCKLYECWIQHMLAKKICIQIWKGLVLITQYYLIC